MPGPLPAGEVRRPVEAAAVVAHAQRHRPGRVGGERHPHVRGAGVPGHVRQRLLHRPEQRQLGVGRQRGERVGHREVDGDAGAFGEVGGERA
jgi:hypothetical protein